MTLAIEVIDELHNISARVRLLELALLGAENSGMSLDDAVYLDALIQQTRDIAICLDAIKESQSDPEGIEEARLCRR